MDQLDLHYTTYDARLGVEPLYPNTGTNATHQPHEVQVPHNCISWYKVQRLLTDTSNSTFGCWMDCHGVVSSCEQLGVVKFVVSSAIRIGVLKMQKFLSQKCKFTP